MVAWKPYCLSYMLALNGILFYDEDKQCKKKSWSLPFEIEVKIRQDVPHHLIIFILCQYDGMIWVSGPTATSVQFI